MRFVGVIAFDSGHASELESRDTKPTSFAIISDWVRSVTEFYQGELNYDPNCKWQEIRVQVFVHNEEFYTVRAEPIQEYVMRSIMR